MTPTDRCVVSGALTRPRVHFRRRRRTPARRDTRFSGLDQRPRQRTGADPRQAGPFVVCHLHPFDDGNGRLGARHWRTAAGPRRRQPTALFTACPRKSSVNAATITRYWKPRKRRDGYHRLAAMVSGRPAPRHPTRAHHPGRRTGQGALWQRFASTPFNPDKSNCLTACWMALTANSPPAAGHRWPTARKTPLRDINQLVAWGVLQRLEGGGRNVGYGLSGQ